jgi:hypothetical protein
LLFTEDGLVKACLNDRDMGRTAWGSGATVLETIDMIEQKLVKGTMEWRCSEKKPGRKPGG